MIGKTLGAYHVLEKLGEGGMGQVFRARDTRLGRDVAIKILPAAFTDDPERLARFEREARILASLTHPHIAAIYGLEDVEGGRALVLELVDGPTLANRIEQARAEGSQAGLPIPDALGIARQVAAALDAAHERGIVHRDLKPANIALTEDGTVKVLDFGLAKIDEPAGSAASSPTITGHATRAGLVLGTAAYMSPEQARGAVVDKRTDIWAFGCVLYEVLAGRLAFPGETISDTLAAVLGREPDWSALPADTPPAVKAAIRACLQKDSRVRLRDIGDVKLDAAPAPAADVPRPGEFSVTRRFAMAAAVLAVTAVAGAFWTARWLSRGAAPAPATHVRFAVMPPPGGGFDIDVERNPLALSPDGSTLAFIARAGTEPTRVWIRALDAVEIRPVAGTEGASSAFWSPDSRSLGFFVGDKLKRINLPNGPALAICDVPEAIGLSGTWGANNEILFASVEGDAIYAVPKGGGAASVILRREESGAARIHYPWFLPDGRRFVYLSRGVDGTGQLMLAERGGASRPILPLVSNAQWIAPDSLVFAREGTLVAQRVDLANARPVGDPQPLSDAVGYSFSTARTMFSTSQTGAVAYLPPLPDAQRLTWFDRRGTSVGTVSGPGFYLSARLSSSGGTVIYDRFDRSLGTNDLFSFDLARNVETRLTNDRTSEANGVLLPDGRAIVFQADRGGPPHLFRKTLATGADEQFLPPGRLQAPMDASGNTLLYMQRTSLGNFDLLTVPLSGPATPAPLIATRFNETDARISPDGRLVAYSSNQSGRNEIYVAPFPQGGTGTQVTSGGAFRPRWAGNEDLYYVAEDRRVVSVPVKRAPEIQVGKTTVLFEMAPGTAWANFDVSTNGDRFLAIVVDLRRPPDPIVITLNAVVPR